MHVGNQRVRDQLFVSLQQTGETQEFWDPGFTWPHPSYCKHLENEDVDESLTVSVVCLKLAKIIKQKLFHVLGHLFKNPTLQTAVDPHVGPSSHHKQGPGSLIGATKGSAARPTSVSIITALAAAPTSTAIAHGALCWGTTLCHGPGTHTFTHGGEGPRQGPDPSRIRCGGRSS